MPKFRVKVTTEALVTTSMEIEAPTEDDAIEEAATQARENGGDDNRACARLLLVLECEIQRSSFRVGSSEEANLEADQTPL